MTQLYYQAIDPVPPLTQLALDRAGATRCWGLTKAHWGQGRAVGFTASATTGIAYGNYWDQMAALDVPHAGHLYIDAENDMDPDDHDHDWRPTRWLDETRESVEPVFVDLATIIAWTRAHRPFCTLGFFQQTDFDPETWDPQLVAWWRFLHDGCDAIEPGGYHLWRNGEPDLGRDLAVIGSRVETARWLDHGGQIRLWTWHRYQGGGVIPPTAYDAYIRAVAPLTPDGLCLFGAHTMPAAYVEIAAAAIS